MASGVLSLGRRTTGEKSTISPVDLVKTALESVASELEGRGIAAKVESGTPGARILVDEEAMRGALINLIMNSAEAMPGGGEILLSVRVIGENTVEIHVTDDGPGIPSDLVSRIFDPFVTTKARGNGFGLPWPCEQRMRMVGVPTHGTWRESGAHFVIEIPLHDSGANA